MDYFLTDTHCHITMDEMYERVDEVIQNAYEANVKRLVIVCTKEKEFLRAVELKKKYENIYIAYGFYPHDLHDVSEEDFIKLEAYIKKGMLDVLGEIGLDYHWDDVDKETQIQGFHRQLKLAKKYNLPISIHMREATKDTIDLLKQYAPLKGFMHCYSGSLESAKEIIKIGLTIAYGGPLTFKNARGMLEVAQNIPMQHLLVETDSPYLTPHPYRGKRNEPKYVAITFEKLCECKQVEKDILAKQLEINFQRIFTKE